jgi:negative regulator of sigma E activity
MKNDSIDQLLKKAAESQPLSNPAEGHKMRFMQKLEQLNAKKKRQARIHFISIAASIVAVIAIGVLFLNPAGSSYDLADVSPEMEQTQHFFAATIEKELREIKNQITPDTKVIVEDALEQLEILEKNYEGLKKDLLKSGNDRRVIYAMISNFQSRIELLENVLHQIERINNQKSNSYEII